MHAVAFLLFQLLILDDQSGLDAGVGAVLFLFLIALYFVPSIIGRSKRNSTAIFMLNLLLGWTVIGWVVAMVWAVAKEAQPVIVNQPAPMAVILCSSCGKYSPTGSKFCATCGTAVA
jgi:hypothetical protein